MVIIKLMLTAGIIIVATLIGIRKSKKFENREKILRESITFFRVLKTEIKYMVSTLPNAIEAARVNLNTSLKDSLGAISTGMLSGNINNQYISENIQNIEELVSYDKQVIINGMLNLGASDVDSQVNIIDNTVEMLNSQYNEAKEERVKNSKLYKTVGLVTGIMIAILFV